MTGPDESTERRLAQSLNHNASQAPGDDQLLDQVRHRVDRRRRTVRVLLAAAAVFAVVLAGTSLRNLTRPADTPATASQTGGASVSDGWRWESHGTVELQVPSSWGYGGDPSQWCVGRGGSEAAYIHRPGPATSVLCTPEQPPLADRVPYVSFSGKPGKRDLDHGWMLETRTIAGTAVTVFTDDADVRTRIFASARQIDGTDTYGCAPGRHDPSTRPEPAGGLGSVGEVKSISVCGYELWRDGGSQLFSGRTFTGVQATGLVDAILASPPGIGPDSPPSQCMPGDPGDRFYLLTVHGTKHDQQVALRYAGCDHNGTDDGTTLRRLTRPVLQPLLTGSDRGYTAMGPVGDLLR